jgi:hypothetical protein
MVELILVNKMSETSEQFDLAFTGLIELARKIHNKKFSGKSEALWLVRLNKLHKAYIKSDNPPGWYDMFYKFYIQNSDSINQSIFNGNKVNDEWLKSTVNFEVSEDETGGWSPAQASCKGQVIYFNKAVNKVFSIAISEIYLSAIDLSRANASDMKIFFLPAQVLASMFKIFSLVVPELSPGYTMITENLSELESTIRDNMSESTEEDDGAGDQFKDMKKMFGDLISKQGGLDGMLKSVMKDGGPIKNAGKILSKLVDKASAVGTEGGIGPLMDVIADTMKDQEFKDEVQSVSAQFDGLKASIPTLENPKGEDVPAGNPADQE